MSEATLAQLLGDFQTNLEFNKNSDQYVAQTVNRVRRIFDECNFVTLADLRGPDAIDRYQSFLQSYRYSKGKAGTARKCSQSTVNHYTVVLKTFCHWAVTGRKMPDCPLLTLRKAKVTENKTRRAATIKECEQLLKAAEQGGEVYGLTGHERAVLYRLALNTGFRVSELASLTPKSFHLDSQPAYVRLEASDAKNKDVAEQPLPAPLVAQLRKFLKSLPADEPVWPGTWQLYAARMVRADLAETDVAGLDFHSLRTTFITNLARQNVHPRKAQELARHSDINLTMKFYTKLGRDELASDLPCI